MKTFAVCELKEHIDEILRLVQEKKEAVQVTKDGEIVALLVPPPGVLESGLPEWIRPRQVADLWSEYDRRVSELGVQWPEGVSAVDAVRDVRGEW